MHNIIEKLSEKISYLKPREIEGILALLLENPGISNNELIRTTGLPKETLRDFKGSISFLLKTPQNDSIYISEEHEKALRAENLRLLDWKLLSITSEEAVNKLKSIRQSHKLTPNRELDQFFATEESSIAKALLLDKKGLLDKTKIAILGDDDLVSISLTLVAKTQPKITVLETDKELLTVISSISKELGKENIQTTEYDVKNELPNVYKGQFDAVITDPPYTQAGVTLFLNRAIELTHIKGDKGGKYIFLYYGTSNKTPEKTIKVQEIINQMGLVLEDKIDKFVQYNGAESIGSSSSVYILRTTSSTKPLSQVIDYSQLYTHQQTKEDKFPFVDSVGIKLAGVPLAIINSKSALLKALGDFCNTHKLKVVEEKTTRSKTGVTVITYILSDATMTVHIWPELSAIHLELTAASAIYNRERLVDTAHKLFRPNSVTSTL